MKPGAVSGAVGVVLALAVTVVSADAIQKWRTPDGALFFGDRPPAGSTLVETIPDTPSRVSAPAAETTTELGRAAEEGRDIIRRREAARIEQAKLDAEREAYIDELEAAAASQPAYETPWYVGTTAPCLPGDLCFDGDRRPHRHRHHDDDGLRRIGRGQQWQGDGRWGRPPLRPLQPAPRRDAMGGALLSPVR